MNKHTFFLKGHNYKYVFVFLSFIAGPLQPQGVDEIWPTRLAHVIERNEAPTHAHWFAVLPSSQLRVLRENMSSHSGSCDSYTGSWSATVMPLSGFIFHQFLRPSPFLQGYCHWGEGYGGGNIGGKLTQQWQHSFARAKIYLNSGPGSKRMHLMMRDVLLA